MNFPYTYISCPCTDVSKPLHPAEDPKDDDEEQERTFDPRSPRANFSLYPPEHLLYCEGCQEIRCPRCIIEEIVCWYCPSCLFEMPFTMVKSEGGRCPRNCFNCPLCTSPLAISSVNPDPNTRAVAGPFVLTCGYCQWSSMDIGWQFEKLSNIPAQMRQLSIGGEWRPPSTPRTPGSSLMEEAMTGEGPDATFSQLKSFYNSQLAVSSGTDPFLTPSGGFNYASPASLARIMSIYNGRMPFGKTKDTKSSIMRESSEEAEGLRPTNPDHDHEIVEKLRTSGWTSTTSTAQRAEQKHQPVRFTTDLHPTQTLLRTKRNKRCRTCRHILVKPEPKVQNTRFRIRLLAVNYIPTITFTPLSSTTTHHPAPQTKIDLNNLPTLTATQFLLTLRNPLFEPVTCTLATPAHTPGRQRHKVTILCPDFTIGANVDQWDEALGEGKNRRVSKVVGAGGGGPGSKGEGGEGGRVAEAGKVWEKGRNWTGVVVEVVCALPGDVGARGLRRGVGEVDEEDDVEDGDEDEDEDEDEDVLEIPIFVRMEWEGDVAADEKEGKGEGKEKRELAFWSVIGVGKVGRLEKDAVQGGGVASSSGR